MVDSRTEGQAITWKMFSDHLGKAEWGQAGAHMCVLAPRLDHVASSLLHLYISVNMGGKLLWKKNIWPSNFWNEGFIWAHSLGSTSHHFVEGTAGRER